MAILYHDEYNLYIPISYVDENFKRAHKVDAVLKEKFYFRKNIDSNGPAEIVELNMEEIFFGNKEFIGLHKMIQNYYHKYHKCEIDNELPIIN